MQEQTAIAYADSSPYPKIFVHERNPNYATQMLDNTGGQNSEMSAIALYLYNNLITGECNKELSECFHKISIIEMKHLRIFGKLACLLGEEPRLWTVSGRSKLYWNPGYNQYPQRIPALLKNILNAELAAVEKYENQIAHIQDPAITAILQRIVLDEKLHVSIFEKMVCNYN